MNHARFIPGIGAALLALSLFPLAAQDRPSGPPPDEFQRKKERGEGERPKGGRGMPPELKGGDFFLQAGDPRFERMLVLAFVPEERVEAELQKWPPYQEADAQGRERVARQVSFFRKRIQGAALREAEQAGIQLAPEQQAAFIRAYWEKRIEVEKRVRAEVEPRLKAEMGRAVAELKNEFSESRPPLGAGK